MNTSRSLDAIILLIVAPKIIEMPRLLVLDWFPTLEMTLRPRVGYIGMEFLDPGDPLLHEQSLLSTNDLEMPVANKLDRPDPGLHRFWPRGLPFARHPEWHQTMDGRNQ